jgi:ribosomal-protein-alanine N-acetyltransferase
MHHNLYYTMSACPPSVLRSSRMFLRKPMLTEVDAVFRVCGDPRTTLFIPEGLHKTRSETQAVLKRWLTHWDRYGFGVWALSLVTSPETLVGVGGLRYADYYGPHERLNLGFQFSADAWGQGLATELAITAVRFGFETLNLDTIWATVREHNQASRRVLEKAGLEQADVLDEVPGAAPGMIYRIDKNAA